MAKLEKTKIILRLFLLFIIILPTPVYAYLDPGTGSMLVSAIIGIIASLFFSLKRIYYGFSRGLLISLGMKLQKKKQPISLLFYSEGKQYWNTFKPVIQELLVRQAPCTYFTQDPDDPGLSLTSPYYSAEFIGIGNKGFSRMNFLEANVCAMTTPGLDVLQIKRSRGVRHYTHLVHAPTDMGTYKLFSFDYYDSIFVSGAHQTKSIRLLESLRGTQSKQIFNIGCLYYDALIRNLKKSETSQAARQQTVLVAPTWGKNGLLKKYGVKLLKPLLESGYQIVVRPHPQSYISELEMLEELKTALQEYKHLSWNRAANGMEIMGASDILISDLSGIIFDFAFLFFKPVITLKFNIEKRGTEANDLPYEVWELEILDIIGKQINESDIPNINDIISDFLNSDIQSEKIQNLRNKSIFNFGNAATLAADHLVDLVKAAENEAVPNNNAINR